MRMGALRRGGDESIKRLAARLGELDGRGAPEDWNNWIPHAENPANVRRNVYDNRVYGGQYGVVNSPIHGK
jgi:hypothetical protein